MTKLPSLCISSWYKPLFETILLTPTDVKVFGQLAVAVVHKLLLATELPVLTNGLSLTFNPDGSGFTSSVGEPNENWEWEIISNNQLKIIYDGGEFEIFNNLNVTSTILKMELESVTYDSDANYEVSHYGIYHFD